MKMHIDGEKHNFKNIKDKRKVVVAPKLDLTGAKEIKFAQED